MIFNNLGLEACPPRSLSEETLLRSEGLPLIKKITISKTALCVSKIHLYHLCS